MGLKDAKEGKLLYHLTELKNLESIIDFGLVPRKILRENTVTFGDVADPEIIRKREVLGLDGYIPFHFHPYSAFDVAVKKTHSSEKFVYICIGRVFAERNDFKILIKHPLSQQGVVLYDYHEGMDAIDWDTMEQVGALDEYSRNVKMAECLTDKMIPANQFQCVYVPDKETLTYIETLFRNNGILEKPPYVSERPTWF